MSRRSPTSRGDWRRRRQRLVTRLVVRPAVDLRGLPIVAVTGTNGKTTVTLLVNRILLDAGYRTGCACTEGVQIEGRWVHRGDDSGVRGLWRANRHRGLDVLVAETGRGTILRHGLGFSSCRVSVVTNLYEDHLGHWGVESLEQMAEVKSALPRHTSSNGVTILNGDQPLVREMARRSPAPAVFFCLTEPPDATADCYFQRDGTIVRRRGGVVEPVVDLDRIFLAHGGAAGFQVENVMAALAAIDALQDLLPVSRSSLEATLESFGRGPGDLPNRLQLYRYRGVDVLVSSSKNPSTYEAEIALLRRFVAANGYRSVVCLVSDVGDRSEGHYRGISRAVGEFGDAVVCLPPRDRYLRGRTPEEMVGLLESEVPAEKRSQIPSPTFDGLLQRFPAAQSEPTLIVAFATVSCSVFGLDEILTRGEPREMRIAGT